MTIDVHQHLWGPRFVESLRRRHDPPYLRGWRLHTSTEPTHDVDPSSHDPQRRAEIEQGCGTMLAATSLSSPLGIERLSDSAELLDGYHADIAELPAPFVAWAAVSLIEPDLAQLKQRLQSGCVGLQLPADALATPDAWGTAAPILDVVADADKPVLIHPGPAPTPLNVPAWWAPVVSYVDQLTAAWWAWHAVGRQVAPHLRVCFVAGAGLAPIHHERLVARGGRFGAVDPDVFVDTSSYGPRALDALIRVLGIDVLVLGSDRPYAEPTIPDLGAAALHAITATNPSRLLNLSTPTPRTPRKGP
ncbi:MAG: amidohydrolase family protein [Nocardioidaceae bacterium]|nr:amidohydrolase family protein [Nocardioidaceae bacterium]